MPDTDTLTRLIDVPLTQVLPPPPVEYVGKHRTPEPPAVGVAQVPEPAPAEPVWRVVLSDAMAKVKAGWTG